MLKIAVAQLALSTKDIESNFQSTLNAINSASTQEVNLLVLPELVNSGYVFENYSEAEKNSWYLDGAEIAEWKDLSKKLSLVIVAGVNLRLRKEKLSNAAVIIDNGEILGVYEKAHLYGNEPDYFEPGNNFPLVVDTSVGRIATMICYDIEFPEWVRYVLLQGAQILALPTNWPETGLPKKPIVMEVVRVQAAASQNKLVIAACDRTGSENGIDWVGQSVIVNSDGIIEKISMPNQVDFLVADIELPVDDSIGPRNSIKADRRTDLYQLNFMKNIL